MSDPKLYGRISADLSDLNALSSVYAWIPNEHSIRPSEESLVLKRQQMAEVERKWATIRDYIYHDVYELPYKINPYTLKRYVDTTPLNNRTWAFVPSHFRYNLPTSANHWILWNSEGSYADEYDDATVNMAIVGALDSHLGHTQFQYAWYKNHKPTVPQLWHVQVFWTNTRSTP